MNRGVLQSSPVQQMMASGNPNWWSINNTRPPPILTTPQQASSSPFLSTPFPNHFLYQYANDASLPPSSSSNNSSSLRFPVAWSDNGSTDQLPEPWSQLLLGNTSHFEAKTLENWEDQVVSNANNSAVGVKQEEFNNMADFSITNTKADLRHPPPDRSSDCSSNGNGGALKKARVVPSSNHQPTCKVRKEKLGDRITALHQLVCPFGKTDTASVLLEAMGYIRFLQNQIEALSLPYLDSGSSNMRQQHSVQGEMSCLFPDDPGQEHEQEPKRDLRSRGLCLVPVSCTLQVGSDNGTDYWPPAFGGGFR